MKNWIVMFLCLFVLSAVSPNVLGAELSIEPIADSYTDSDAPDVNHGGSSSLYSYYYELELINKSYEQDTWLKFDLSEIPSEATVNSIILRMHTFFTTSTTNKVGVFLCSNTDWGEMEITWNNCPEVTGQPIGIVYIGSSDTDYDFDVTSAVEGKDVVTLVLKTLEPTELVGWADFVSKEYALSQYHPELVVDYTTPSQPLTIDPLWGILIVGLIVVAVVIPVAYVVTRKKKGSLPPSTPEIPPSSPS